MAVDRVGYMGKTMLSSSYSFHKLEEDGIVEYVVVLNMVMKDGTRESEVVESISEKDYFAYKLGKKYDMWNRLYKRKENGS